MQDSRILTTAAIAVVVGGSIFAAYRYRGYWVHLLPFDTSAVEEVSAVTGAGPQQPPAGRKVNETKKPPAKIAPSRAPRSPSVAPAPPRLAESTGAPPQDPKKPMPPAEDIHPGMSKARLREAFEQPTLSVTGIEGGRLQESYFYSHDRQGKLTTAHIEDGKVVSVETSSH